MMLGAPGRNGLAAAAAFPDNFGPLLQTILPGDFSGIQL